MDLDAMVRTHGALLVETAEEAIRATLEGRRWDPDTSTYPVPLREPRACFVSLYDGHRLLGCIGVLEPELPLIEAVADRARRAAFSDPRFLPIAREEFERMTLEVSVLSPVTPLRVRNLAELKRRLRPGVDGVVIEVGTRRATFLPDVWRHLPDASQFLDALWSKAGLTPGTWPSGLRIGRYVTAAVVGQPPRRSPAVLRLDVPGPGAQARAS